MKDRDQVLTVKLVTDIDGTLYQQFNNVGADYSTFESGSNMELVDAMGQRLEKKDVLNISYDANRGTASYDLRVGASFTGLSHKAHVQLVFSRCEVQYELSNLFLDIQRFPFLASQVIIRAHGTDYRE